MIHCPPQSDFELYLAGDLAPNARPALEEHLEACPDCQDLLEKLTSSDVTERWRRLRSEPAPPGSFTRPPLPGDAVRLTPPVADHGGGVSTTIHSLVRRRPVETGPLPQVSGYELIEEIGRGGMGVVYKARHAGLGRLVALKMVLGGAGAGAEARARLRREAESVARLQHPNIVQIFEVGNHDHGPYLALEYVAGGSLARRLTGAPHPPRDAAELIARLADAVHYAHGQGVVHRDLKPANVLLQDDLAQYPKSDEQDQTELSSDPGPTTILRESVPKITDFGLARWLDGGATLTATGIIAGTPSYMAPEQAVESGSPVGPAADVYALGAILYELLTGRPPFRGESPLETLVQVVHQDPVPPRALQPKVPRDLETVCLKCLRKEPPRRYASAHDLAKDLRRFLAGEPIRARPVGRLERAWRWCRRRPREAALAGLAAAAVAAGLSAWGWQARARAEMRARTTRTAQAAVREATLLRGKRRWPEALAAARRAEELLEQGAADSALREEVGQLVVELRAEEKLDLEAAAAAERDRRLAAELDEIQQEKTTVVGGQFNVARTAPRYARAFAGARLDPLEGTPDEAAARLRGRAIRAELVAALDDWASGEPNPACRRRLIEVARAADPHPWRERLRDALGNRDLETLRNMARSPEANDLPPATAALLGVTLIHLGDLESAVESLRASHRRHAGDFWIAHYLGFALTRFQPPRWNESARAFAAATAARPDNPGARINLGHALRGAGDHAAAAAQYREAIRLRPDYAAAHAALGLALTRLKNEAGALAALRRAVELEPRSPAIRSDLGFSLGEFRRHEEAVTALRGAIEVDPTFHRAHYNLGVQWMALRRLEEAAASFRETVRLRPDYADAHYFLGAALFQLGAWDQSAAAFRRATELQPDSAAAHCDLGRALDRQGKFEEALAALRRGHELGSRRPGWQNPSGRWVQEVSRRLELDRRLSAVLSGQAGAPRPAEAIELARLCLQYKRRYASAARLFEQAFAAEPALADELSIGNRFHAARAAALAAFGQGEDATGLDPAERNRWRRQTFTWLRADLAARAKSSDGVSPAARQVLSAWLTEPAFAPLRDPGRLPESERDDWKNFWQEMERRRAGG